MKYWIILFFMFYSYAASAVTYHIGALLPLSGSRAEKGIPLKNAMELYVKQLNEKNAAQNLKFELIVRDDFNDSEKARAVAIEMVKDPLLVAMIGHYYTSMALSTQDVFAEAGIPMISPNVTNPKYVGYSPWMFMVNLPDDQQGGFMATYIKAVLNKQRVLVVHDSGPFGTALRDAFIQKANRIGLNIHKILEVTKDADLPENWAKQNLPNAEENKLIDMVVGLSSPETGLKILPALREHQIAVPVMAVYTWDDQRFFKLPAHYTKDVYLTSAFLWELANRKAHDYAQAYQDTYHVRPTPVSAMAYDTLLLLTHAFQHATSTMTENTSDVLEVRKGIREYLVNLDWHHAIEGITGLLSFSNKYDKTQEYIKRYLNSTQLPTAVTKSNTKTSPQAVPPVTSPVEPNNYTENRIVQRDVFVSIMQDQRLRPAPVQLTQPHEEYVLTKLAERIQEKRLLIIDETPYHVVDVVYVGIDIVRIDDVDVSKMLWDVDLFMWFKWYSPHLTYRDIEKIVAIETLKEQGTLLNEQKNENEYYRAYRKKLTLNATYDLSRFPFDEQTLSFSLAHSNKHSTSLMLVLDERHMETTPINDIKPHEWRYLDHMNASGLYRYQSTFGDPNYRLGKDYKSPIYFSTVNFKLRIKRILQPYMYTFFLPLSILMCIILLIIWVPLDLFPSRIGACISGMVGILVYHMSQKNAFPKVGYTMVADYYFLVAYVVVIALIIMIILLQHLISEQRLAQAQYWNVRIGILATITVVSIYGTITLTHL
jgi:branched-chain amino acid transport system substrate-binding protein